MNLILLFLGITTAVDASFEDNRILFVLKILLSIITLFQPLFYSYRAFQRPEIFISFMFRTTIEYFAPEYFKMLHNKDQDDFNFIDKFLYRFDSCDDGELKYRFVKGKILRDEFLSFSNWMNYEYDDNYRKNLKLLKIRFNSNLFNRVILRVNLDGEIKQLIVEPEKVISSFKFSNYFLYVINKDYKEQCGDFRIAVSKLKIGLDFFNEQEIYMLVKKKNKIFVNLYHKLNKKDKYYKLIEILNFKRMYKNIEVEIDDINNVELNGICCIDEGSNIDMYYDEYDFGWVK